MKELLEFVQSSVHRWKIVLLLGDGMTVTQISEEIGAHSSQVSRTLKELRENELVECITPQKRKGRLYSLTAHGRKIRDELRTWNGRPSLNRRVAIVLDEFSIPYAKNAKLNPEGRSGVADFVILDDKFKPQMAIAVRDLPSEGHQSLKEAAFWVGTWRKETEGLKTALVLGGKSKEEILKEEGKFFLNADFFDVVLHEDDLECVKKKELELEKFLEVEKHCGDWPTAG